MYSKNDYRYYLEHRLEESDDYLAHYGVKGMKWRKHKAGLQTELSNIKTDLRNRGYGDKDHTYIDPVNGKIKSRKTRKAGESSTEDLGFKDAVRGDYKIKKRTSKSKLFKGLKKVSGNKDYSKVEKRAAKERQKKKVDIAMYKVNRDMDRAFKTKGYIANNGKGNVNVFQTGSATDPLYNAVRKKKKRR